MSLQEAIRSQLTEHQIYDHKQVFTYHGISRYGKIIGTGRNLAVAFEEMTIMNKNGQAFTLPAITVNI